MLDVLLRQRMERDHLSAREVSRQLGIGHPTVLRVLEGEMPRVELLVKLCDWLGVRPASVLGGAAQTDVSGLIEITPGLKEVLEDARRAVEAGVDPAIIDDIVAYAQYRLSMTKGRNNVSLPYSGPDRRAAAPSPTAPVRPRKRVIDAH